MMGQTDALRPNPELGNPSESANIYQPEKRWRHESVGDQPLQQQDQQQQDQSQPASSSSSLSSPPPSQYATQPLEVFRQETGEKLPGRAWEPTDGDGGDEDEPAVAEPFMRRSSPDPVASGDDDIGAFGKDSRASGYNLHKFTLYETTSYYYIVGHDVAEKRYRILKIDRSTEDGTLGLTDDKIVYSQKEIDQLLDTIDDGNRGTGGIKLRCTAWGLLGFIKFTGPYYMLLVTKKSTVAVLGGHYVYQVDGTELILLTAGRTKPDARNTEESRFLSTLTNLDLSRSFYYSYGYDITRSLQNNITAERDALARGEPTVGLKQLNSMFVWNDHLLQPTAGLLRDPYDWCRPIIHGYIDQSAISIYSRNVFVTIIARRSRFFAGARFLKRGANDLGYVANDVETEQIVSDTVTTSFHAPGPRLFCSPQYTSYIQHRGSIPLYWSQDNTGVTPKPPIELNLVDPFYSAAALHFDDLFERYGCPIYVLNLVKAKERTPRESKLLREFASAVDYLNQFLPQDRKIAYYAFDMSRAAKSRDQDVIGTLDEIAETVVQRTGIFHNGDGRMSPVSVQNGVVRTNCIDCLDRTNAAQFIIGKRVLGYQLRALGVLETRDLEYDSDAVNLFTHMYHDHGDTIAVQYGGSQLVNTMETYRRINQWSSHSRDMIESFRRYYNNSFLDGQRQEAYNLFLGNYIFAQGQPMLWDLPTDYYLHHADPRKWTAEGRRNYIDWYTPGHLEPKRPPPVTEEQQPLRQPVSLYDDYWLEYYRPSILSSFPKMFLYKMNSTIRHIPLKVPHDTRYDLSPFKPRTDGEGEAHERRKMKKEVVFLGVQDAASTRTSNDSSSSTTAPGRVLTTIAAAGGGVNSGISIQRWLQPVPEQAALGRWMFDDDHRLRSAVGLTGSKLTALEKTKATQRTFTKLVHESLNPSVKLQEVDDYAQYVSHPQNLPLVVSAENPADYDPDYQEYVHGSWQLESFVQTSVDDDDMTYEDLLKVGESPLTVTEEDARKKRYKAYHKWLMGKSFFKQLPVD